MSVLNVVDDSSENVLQANQNWSVLHQYKYRYQYKYQRYRTVGNCCVGLKIERLISVKIFKRQTVFVPDANCGLRSCPSVVAIRVADSLSLAKEGGAELS